MCLPHPSLGCVTVKSEDARIGVATHCWFSFSPLPYLSMSPFCGPSHTTQLCLFPSPCRASWSSRLCANAHENNDAWQRDGRRHETHSVCFTRLLSPGTLPKHSSVLRGVTEPFVNFPHWLSNVAVTRACGSMFGRLPSWDLWEVKPSSLTMRKLGPEGRGWLVSRLTQLCGSWHLSGTTLPICQLRFTAVRNTSKQKLPPLIMLSHTETWLDFIDWIGFL